MGCLCSGIKQATDWVYNQIPDSVIPDSYYRRFAAWCRVLKFSSSTLDHVAGMGHYGFDIAYRSSQIAGKPIEELASFRNDTLYARLALSSTKVFTALHDVFSGAMFFQGPDKKGKFFRNDNGSKIWRHPLSIATDVAMLGARILTPVSNTFRILITHNNERYAHLKQHAANIGIAMCVFYTLATVFDASKSIQDLAFIDRANFKQEAKGDNAFKKHIVESILNLFESGLSLPAMLAENGVLIFDVHPVLSLVISSFGFIAHSFSLVKEAILFEIPDPED